MFNEEEFINNYVETLKNEEATEDDLTKLTAGLPQDKKSGFYTKLVEKIIKALKGAEGDHSTEIKRLENTVALMSFMSELADQDSNTEATKEADNSEPVEVVAEDATATGVAEVADDGHPVASEGTEAGDAPAEEEQAEKEETK